MEYQDVMEKLGAIKDAANVQRVFGEPQTFADRMIIPVAQVRTGMGVGLGTGKAKHKVEGDGEEPEGEGIGGGGGAMSHPVGVVEVTSQGTTFIPIKTPISPMGYVILGIGLGMMFRMMRGRCNHEY